MRELIERLRKLPGPCRETSNEVLFACGWTVVEEGPGPDRVRYWVAPEDAPIDPVHGGEYADGDQPDPTGSVDAALTLVPKDLDYELKILGTQDEPTWTCASIRWWKDRRATNEGRWRHRDGNHKSDAIALCIASLKAREALRTESGGDRG